MDAFPAFFPLAGRKVVVAGEGVEAEAKARLFDGSPAEVIRLAPAQAHDPQAFAGACLAFIAGGDEPWATAAAQAARAAGAVVNVVDRPHLCDFTTPAIVDRGAVVAAIGTGGGSPMLATLLRRDLEARVPQGAGRVAVLFARLQDELRAALPEAQVRRAFLRAALEGPIAQAAMDGDMERAAAMFREALSRGGLPAGIVRYLQADGAADLLSLRAAQALAAADVLVIDRGVSPPIVDLARRDAERRDAASIEDLAALAARGLSVVRLTTDDLRLEQVLLTSLGVAVEVLPVAA